MFFFLFYCVIFNLKSTRERRAPAPQVLLNFGVKREKPMEDADGWGRKLLCDQVTLTIACELVSEALLTDECALSLLLLLLHWPVS